MGYAICIAIALWFGYGMAKGNSRLDMIEAKYDELGRCRDSFNDWAVEYTNSGDSVGERVKRQNMVRMFINKEKQEV